MRAIVMSDFGGADVLQLAEVPDPEAPAAGRALVRVHAVEVSRTRDVMMRTGKHPFSQQVTLPHTPGGDFAGVVEAVGEGVDESLVGRRVAVYPTETCGQCAACTSGHEPECQNLSMLGIHRPGSYAEYVSVLARNVHPIPDDVSMTEAAAMAADGPIGWTQLDRAGLAAGDWLLVTGATGALGTILTALGSHHGARVIGLTRRPELLERQPGDTVGIDVGDADLTATLQRVTEGAGVTVVADNVCDPEVFTRYFPAIANGGRVVVSGVISAEPMPLLPVPSRPFYLNSISLLGIRTATPRDADGFWALVNDGFRLPKALIEELPLEQASEAHTRILEGRSAGHVVLTVT